MKTFYSSRRAFLRRLGIAGIGTAALSWPALASAAAEKGKKEQKPDVLPVEDLMREHGVLNRVLLIYEEITARIRARRDIPAGALSGAAGIVHNFIESYHEKNEENYIFPRFEKSGKDGSLKSLTAVLRVQHKAGRRLTRYILGHADEARQAKPDTLIVSIGQFIRMYRPHKAREDTVLFPAFHDMISSSEYAELGEKFEGEEHRLFGKNGFEDIVKKTAAIEESLGINGLGKFTPA